MSLSNEVKKKILNDWLGAFPQLSSYAQNKLYKVVGPIVAGIEIPKLPRTDEYRPTFACYSLWKSNEKECLEEPIFLLEMNNTRGFQLDISYNKHESIFHEAVACIRKQILIPFDRDVSLKGLFEMINNQFLHMLVKSSPVGQAKLYECKLFSALYVNDTALINKVLNEINQAAKSWQPSLFEWKFGKLDLWLQGLQEKIKHREDFLKQIEGNKQGKKISQLKTSELLA